MKITSKIFLIISISINICSLYIIYEIQRNKSKNEIFGGRLNKTSWSKGFESFKVKHKEKYGFKLKKKFYFVNIWATWCIPCVKEIPVLDSLAGTFTKDIGFVFVSDQTDKVITNCLKNNKIKIKNFELLNDMNDFVSGIYNKKRIKEKTYPINLIIDSIGVVYYYSNGTLEKKDDIIRISNLINKLP